MQVFSLSLHGSSPADEYVQRSERNMQLIGNPNQPHPVAILDPVGASEMPVSAGRRLKFDCCGAAQDYSSTNGVSIPVRDKGTL